MKTYQITYFENDKINLEQIKEALLEIGENLNIVFNKLKSIDLNSELLNSLLIDNSPCDLHLVPYEFVAELSLLDYRFLFTSLPKLEIERNQETLGKTGWCLAFLRNRTDLVQLFYPYFGKVWLIGAGAGNKELITVKGKKRVKDSDVIISDFLLDQNMLNSYISKDTSVIPLTKYGARTKKNKVSQQEINECILRYAMLENKVVRLKGGDPFVFGRGGEECEYILPFKIHYEIVPGISAMLSALSYSGIPLTHRDYNGGFVVITGYRRECETTEECHSRISNRVNFALQNDLMVVLFMALSNWKNFHTMIDNQEAPTALIESGAYPRQKVFTCVVSEAQGIIEKEQLKSPTLIAVGENVRARDHLKWYDILPLHGVKVLSFASAKLSNEIDEMITDLGGNPMSRSLYDLLRKPLSEIKDYFLYISKYDYLIITSRNAFDFLMDTMKELQVDIRNLPKIIVTGEKTEEEFKKMGIIPDIVPQTFSSEGIIEELKQLAVKGKKFLLPKSSLSRGDISQFLIDSEALLDEFVLYQNQAKDMDSNDIQEMRKWGADYIIFTSSSSVNYFMDKIYSPDLEFKAIPIGNKTAYTLEKHGITHYFQPDTFNLNGVKEVLLFNEKEDYVKENV